MPVTVIRVFQDANGDVPLSSWRKRLLKKNKRAYAKCIARVGLLEAQGSELRRPIADLLRDGIYELRARSGTEQHRVLYFFAEQNVAVLSNGCQKESTVSEDDIDTAIMHKKLVAKDIEKYSLSMTDWLETLDV
ncbi:MAG: type II toxin-antitoxin system RelE/ParE family toxin [Pirellulales bacterium]|nr:type II toxin-antitoxin system RelE/ParE family toxin [Pirellulales bacterium]